eukprot:TRINITY_DN12511_c1_g1_i10.p1 TRINITY_DN12511_c1_g1~~TRINITY_DN12511_c1_g1_i10.p1  ORF type:complete len:784 (+),score=125.20 TRINITY_DN12511_c1_g1_i10:1795-4146(+)
MCFEQRLDLSTFCGSRSPSSNMTWVRVFALFSLSAAAILESDDIFLSIDTQGRIERLAQSSSAANTIQSPLTDYVRLTLVDDDGQFSVNLPGDANNVSVSNTGTEITIELNHLKSSRNQDIELLSGHIVFSLDAGSNVINATFGLVNADDTAHLGLWQVAFSLDLASDSQDRLFFPAGFGVQHSPPFTSHGNYPSSSATMQFLAFGGSPVRQGQGVYLAAHDPNAHMKEIESIQGVDQTTLQIMLLAENAGLAFATYKLPFGFAIGVTTQVPVWYEASQLYRKFVLSNTAWTRAGPISERSDMPDWHVNNSIWINSGWQCHDIFNDTEGDPHTVLDVTSKIRARFNRTMSLHWYEWQQGPDPSPSARYKFDTHYPDYLPARGGDYFRTVVNQLQADGVNILPYINGRIFDIGSESYVRDDGGQYCCLEAAAKFGATELKYYNESYGSKAVFHPADPTTEYWQQALAKTVDALVNEYDVRGVYLDQLGAAQPSPDWSRGHGHPLGGGAYWRDGVVGILRAIRSMVGEEPPMVTESNAEAYMDVISGYLTLVAFDPPFASGAPRVLVPAFPAIYGGYYVGFGDIFNAADLADQRPLSARIVAQFVYGTQMGWFSLGGVVSGPNVDTRCGKMGEFEGWMSSQADDVVTQLQLLADARRHLLDYLAHGRLMRPPVLDPEPFTFMSSSPATRNTGPFASAMSSIWINPTGDQMIVIAASAVTSEQSFNVTLDLTTYIDNLPASVMVSDLNLPDGPATVLGSQPACNVELTLKLVSLGVAGFGIDLRQQ